MNYRKNVKNVIFHAKIALMKIPTLASNAVQIIFLIKIIIVFPIVEKIILEILQLEFALNVMRLANFVKDHLASTV